LYFTEEQDPAELAKLVHKWQRSRAVQKATLKLQGKAWQDLTDDEKAKTALSHHYNQLAYLLYSHHYAEVGQADKTKLDTARTALEAKLAGTAGKGDPLTQFFDDIKTGKLKLAGPVAGPVHTLPS
jgi:phosphoglucomutase